MFSLTVGEAAAKLGVSTSRVYQLIRSGVLDAEQIGRMWLVDDASVRARAASAARPGRPRTQRSGPRRYTLMNRTHEVIEFGYDERRHRFCELGALVDPSRAPLGLVSPRGRKIAATALGEWWEHRAIPGTRHGLERRLEELGLNVSWELPFKSLGLSLSDQYWVRPIGLDVVWEDINFFDNDDLPELETATWLGRVGLDSPDNTSEGELPKTWVSIDGRPFLAKGGEGIRQQPYNEVVATALYRRVLPEGAYVPYQITWSPDGPVSLCPDFVSRCEEYIPAFYARQVARQPNHVGDYQHYLDCCRMLGVDGAELRLDQMLVLDDLIANADRHWRNFGIVRDVETLECRVAPLFDAGTSLWQDVPIERLRRGDYRFLAKPFFRDPNRQLRLVDDLSWLDIHELVDFPEEVEAILSESEDLAPRAPFIAEGVRQRIEHLRAML